MKKTLLSLLMAVGGVLCASAATQTADFGISTANSKYESSKTSTGWNYVNCQLTTDPQGFVINGKTTAVGSITSPVLNDGISTLSFKYFNPNSESNGVDITIQILQNEAVVASQVLDNNDNDACKSEQTFTSEDFAISGDFQIKIKNNSPSNNSSGNKDRVKIYNLTWESNAGSQPAAVARPVISMEEGDYCFNVSMTCETEGAEIHYTTDGTEPTAESTKYTAPVEVWEETTFKAVAVKGEDVSGVATYTAAPRMIFTTLGELSNIDADALGGESVSVIVKDADGAIKVAYQSPNKQYVFLQQSQYGINSYIQAYYYTSNAPTLTVGQSVSRIDGNFKYYNNTPEFDQAEITVTDAAPVEITPFNGTIDMVALNYINWYLSISGATVDTTAKTITVDGTTVPYFNRFNIENINAGENMTVIGFVGENKGTAQFYPVKVLSADAKEYVDSPVFTPEGGTVFANTEVEIYCDTEGATIYYTTDGTEPTAESDEYTEAIVITEDMTIKAFAVKEGYEDSPVVTATYTVKADTPVEGTTAAFDFTDFNSLTFATEVTYPSTTSTGVNIEDNTLSDNGVEVSFTSTNDKGVKFWHGTAKAGDNLRIYKGSTMTVSVSPAYTLTKIVLAKGGSDSNWGVTLKEGESGNYDATSTTWTAEAAEAEETPAVARAAAKAITAVTFEVASSANNTYLKSIDVEFEKVATGVEAVEVEEAAEAVYYNLQGVRVDNPANGGLYIRVAGKKATKVIF